MLLEKSDIPSAVAIINKDFGLEYEDQNLETDEALFKWLTRIIHYLLEKNFEKLLQAMYRIDVSEEKFKAVFAQEGNIAENIAQLVFDREVQKVLLRKKYSQQ